MLLYSAPVVAMVWEGKDVVKTGRAIIGRVPYQARSPVSISIYSRRYNKGLALQWRDNPIDSAMNSKLFAGATNPLAADPGSIRGQYAIDVGRNIIHGSDSVESAQREIGLWFPEGLAEYRPHMGPWVYEKF